MGFSSFNQQNKTMDDNEYDDEEEGLDSFLSNSFCDDISSVVSSESDPIEDQEEVNSSLKKTSPDSEKIGNGGLGDMSSLAQQLPFKRGLSKHFQGKSQSFTSLSNVLCVEDLAKPENPYNKKIKSCKSYGGLLLLSASENNSTKNKKINNNNKKGSSKGSCSSLNCAKRNNISFLGNNNSPPPPHRSTSTNNFSNQTPLLA